MPQHQIGSLWESWSPPSILPSTSTSGISSTPLATVSSLLQSILLLIRMLGYVPLKNSWSFSHQIYCASWIVMLPHSFRCTATRTKSANSTRLSTECLPNGQILDSIYTVLISIGAQRQIVRQLVVTLRVSLVRFPLHQWFQQFYPRRIARKTLIGDAK